MGGGGASRGAARGTHGRGGGGGQRLPLPLLLLHAAVLEPDLHLGVAEAQRTGHLQAAGPRQVPAEVKLLLQLRELPGAEAGACGAGGRFPPARRRAACNAEKHRASAGRGEGSGAGVGAGGGAERSRDGSSPRPRPAAPLTSPGRAPLRSHPLEGAGGRRGGRGAGGGPGAGREAPEPPAARAGAGAGGTGLRRRRAAAPGEDGRGEARRPGSAGRPVAGARRCRGGGRVPRRPRTGRQRGGRGAGRDAQSQEGAVPTPGVGGLRGPAAQPGREGEGKVPQVHGPRGSAAPRAPPGQ